MSGTQKVSNLRDNHIHLICPFFEHVRDAYNLEHDALAARLQDRRRRRPAAHIAARHPGRDREGAHCSQPKVNTITCGNQVQLP